MSKSFITFLIGLVLAACLFIWCINTHAPMIQADIAKRVVTVMNASGASATIIPEIDGRDVTLTGTVENEVQSARVAELIEAIEGVRVVTNNIEIEQQPIDALPMPETVENEPPPIEEEPELSLEERRTICEQDIALILKEGEIVFESGSADLTPESFNVLQTINETLETLLESQ